MYGVNHFPNYFLRKFQNQCTVRGEIPRNFPPEFSAKKVRKIPQSCPSADLAHEVVGELARNARLADQLQQSEIVGKQPPEHIPGIDFIKQKYFA
jgi:hypothetical protein